MTADLIYRWPEQTGLLAGRLQAHNKLFTREVLTGVLSIFDEVGSEGDAAIRRLTQLHDRVGLGQIALSDEEVDRCVQSLSPSLRSAIEHAIRNVREVNKAVLPVSWERQIRPGTVVGEIVRALDSVGIWIPARKGPLLSTAIMLVAAAKTAGVPRIVVGMPPSPDGNPGTVAAAKLAGADSFVIGNGVAIIAGFAQGTDSVPEVDGIFGPGPGGIAAAMSVAMTYGKKSVVGIGPTECILFADDTADPLTAAYDLINEAEHGPDSAAILVTTSMPFARQVEARLHSCIDAVEEQRRRNLRDVFGPGGKGAILVAADLDAACDFINGFAPEHLMIAAAPDTQSRLLAGVRHAGEILLGGYTPFAAANYAIGITAVLPTNRFARAFSGITARDMVKYSTIGKLDREALQTLQPIVKELGAYEQLPCHIQAAAIRLLGEC